MSEGEKVGETTKKTAKEWAERLREKARFDRRETDRVHELFRGPEDREALAALLLAQDALLVRAMGALEEVRSGEDADFEHEWQRDLPEQGCDCAMCDDIRNILAALREHLEPKEPTE